VLGAFYLVWLLNLYNFMDGIDGLASIEAISVLLVCTLSVLGSNERGNLFITITYYGGR